MALDKSVSDYYGLHGNNEWQDAGQSLQSAYASNPAYLDAYYKLAQNQGAYHSNDRAGLVKRLDAVTTQYKDLYKNSVGRDPTDDEIGKFITDQGTDAIINSPLGRSEQNTQNIRNQIAQYVGDTAQSAAQDVATQKTKDLASQYGSLADQYMEMGKKSLGNLSDELQGYSTSLFDKLRPQLNLAAQAGGYADSGGQTLQEQGALKDLANQGRGVLANAAYGVENNANNIRYGGIAAPVSMASQFAANAPYAVQNLGMGGLGFNNADAMAQNNYMRQLGAMNAQTKMTQELNPTFGYTLTQGLATNPFAGSATGGKQGGLISSGGQGLGAAFGGGGSGTSEWAGAV